MIHLASPTLHGSDVVKKRQEIKAYFQACYQRYASLFSLINNESAYYKKSDPLRHPLIFYFGHTATFFINKLKLAKMIEHRIDPKLESIFAVGVDEMSWDDLDEAHYDWPSLAQTHRYRERVYSVVNTVIDSLPLTLPITQDSPWWVILMGIEHENIHLETSSVLIRQLPLEDITPNAQWSDATPSGRAPQNVLIEVEGGEVVLGKPGQPALFGWDNEFGQHQVRLPSFSAAKYLTSNAEYLEFVKDGGYHHTHFWSKEGEAWLRYSGVRHPRFWIEVHEGYRLRTLTQEIVLPLNWPVEVNYHEAEAFCRWKSVKMGQTLTLPTEDEYIRLREVSGVASYLQWHTERKRVANIELSRTASPVAVDSYAHGEFYDVIGNVWQWTRTPIYPLNGFKVHPVYDDFTVPTFDGKHNLIHGGSWISCGNLATHKSRYAFRRHFYQHAGFRYIQSHYEESTVSNYYTSDPIISQYCHFGWGENQLGIVNYPQTCAKRAVEWMGDRPKRKALDVGCAIGRSSFELARAFEEVTGVDFSARFIQEAQSLKSDGILRYSMPTEGELEAFYEVSLEAFGLEHVKERVTFWQADACNLKPLYSGFDLIFAGNLIDRLYDPRKFLDSLPKRLNRGGLLILTSPYTWQEESTPKEKWIGGYKRDGESLSSLEGLKEILEKDFSLIGVEDIPFVIQETARKHQHTIAQMTVWEKR